MNSSEAGKKGYLNSKAVHEENYRIRLEKYEENPKRCKLCNSPIGYKKRTNGFCNHSCAAAYTNGHRGDNIKPHPCLWCGRQIQVRCNRTYCSGECRASHTTSKVFDKIRNGEYVATFSGNGVLKRFLIADRGYGCEECNLTEWRGEPIPLNVHHVDGAADNNRPDNLKLLCLNCHGLTNNYGRKNKKSSRKNRYLKQPN